MGPKIRALSMSGAQDLFAAAVAANRHPGPRYAGNFDAFIGEFVRGEREQALGELIVEFGADLSEVDRGERRRRDSSGQ